MTNASIQPFAPGSGALSAARYETFEMAKENDDVLGSDNIAQIRSYAAYARAQAQAIHKTIAATNGIDDVAAIKSEATETAQTFAKVSVYADQRIGEILRELPTSNRWSDSPKGKTDTIKESGMSTKTAYDLQAMAANPEVVQAVLDKAEAEGRIPSRKQVLDAIKDRDMARKVGETLKRERDDARANLQDALDEISALEKQNDQLYEQAQAASEPKVVTREVLPPDVQKRISSLEYDNRRQNDDYQKLRKKNEELRKELDRAKDMLGMDKTLQDVRKDVQYLTAATIHYVRRYGGLTWTAASFAQVDEDALDELRTAAINLATFANALVASLESFNG